MRRSTKFPGAVLVALFFCCTHLLQGGGLPAGATEPPCSPRAEALMNKAKDRLTESLEDKGLQLGTPLFIRIFKLEGELEVWLQKDDEFIHYKTYPICSYSGLPGPKLYEGDWQSPEGFYAVDHNQMNPNSNFHLSFDIGYPNALDQALHRTGGDIMVHGSCSSVGCFAMTNHRIEEIYTLAHEALGSGQDSFQVHVFPFRMTKANMEKFHSSPWFPFWQNLEQGYTFFENTHKVPEISINENNYVISDSSRLTLHTSSGAESRRQ